MRRILGLIGVGLLLVPAAVFAQTSQSVSVTCDTGAEFDNGVEIIVGQIRSGFTYTATAIGLNGFDPVLAVLGEDGDGLCNDDDAVASVYAADLPTTGTVPPSNLSSQVTFHSTSDTGFQDISLIVGGFGGQQGEVVLILEGMGVTSADNAGDPFSVNITPEMVGAGVPLTLYMLTRGQSAVDPLIYMVDADFNVITDDQGNQIGCDDAGNPELCWGDSIDLSDYSITIDTGTLPGWQYDAMLMLPLDGFVPDADREFNFFNFLMTSFQNQTQGEYLLAYHFGIGDPVPVGTSGSNGGVAPTPTGTSK